MHSLIEHILELGRVFGDCEFSQLWKGGFLYGLSSFGDTKGPEAGLLVIINCLLQLLRLGDVEIFFGDLEDVIIVHIRWLLDGHGKVVVLSHQVCQNVC
jgi:hypothetical protein